MAAGSEYCWGISLNVQGQRRRIDSPTNRQYQFEPIYCRSKDGERHARARKVNNRLMKRGQDRRDRGRYSRYESIGVDHNLSGKFFQWYIPDLRPSCHSCVIDILIQSWWTTLMNLLHNKMRTWKVETIGSKTWRTYPVRAEVWFAADQYRAIGRLFVFSCS